jgi:hypothetical protein
VNVIQVLPQGRESGSLPGEIHHDISATGDPKIARDFAQAFLGDASGAVIKGNQKGAS